MASQAYALSLFLLLAVSTYALHIKHSTKSTMTEKNNSEITKFNIEDLFKTEADIYVVNRYGGEILLPRSDNPKGHILLVLAPSTIKNVGTNPHMTKIIAESPACYEKTYDDRQSKLLIKEGTFAEKLVELNGKKNTIVNVERIKQPKLEWKLSKLCKLRTFYMDKKTAIKKCRQLQANSRKLGKWGYLKIIEPDVERSNNEQCPPSIYYSTAFFSQYTQPLQSAVWHFIEEYATKKKSNGADEFLITASGLEEDIVPSENAVGQLITIQYAPLVLYLNSLNPEHTIIINKAPGDLSDGSEAPPISVLMPRYWVKEAKLWVIDGGNKNAKLRFYER